MNSGAAQSKKGANIGERVAEWRELLEQCGRKPTRRRVHALRVVTLRIQAELEHEAAELPHASHQAQAMLRFGKLGEKLRQALGKVRELDVWIGKLAALADHLREKTDYVPRSTRESMRQIERLTDRLAKQRRRSAEKLIKEIEKRRDGLLKAAEAVDEATSENIHGGKENLSAAILNEFAVVAADFPEFNEENLHDFRKGIKKFRYLAELHSEDAGCQWIAAQVKKAQAAIGEWHDWQVLARTAREARHGRDVEIAEVLESLSGERFTDAVASCDGLRARLLERAAGGQSLPKPPGRNEQIDESIERLA